VATGINLTQKPTHDTSSEKDDVFHEERIGIQAEEVHFISYVSVTSCTWLFKLPLTGALIMIA